MPSASVNEAVGDSMMPATDPNGDHATKAPGRSTWVLHLRWIG